MHCPLCSHSFRRVLNLVCRQHVAQRGWIFQVSDQLVFCHVVNEFQPTYIHFCILVRCLGRNLKLIVINSQAALIDLRLKRTVTQAIISGCSYQ